MSRMRQDEMGAELAHDCVVVENHVGADGMLRQPGGDLVSPTGSGHISGGHIHHAAGEPLRFQHVLKLGDGLAVPQGGRHHDVGSAARHDLIQHPNARGVQIPVLIPSADRRQHAVDVEKDHSLCHPRAMTSS
jgi:hypothetical protein